MNDGKKSIDKPTKPQEILELEKKIMLLTNELEELESELSELQVKGNRLHNSKIKQRELIAKLKNELANIKRTRCRLIRKYEPDKTSS